MAAAVQAEGLFPRVKPQILEAFKGSMDGKTNLHFIHQCELYFSFISMYNTYIQALLTV